MIGSEGRVLVAAEGMLDSITGRSSLSSGMRRVVASAPGIIRVLAIGIGGFVLLVVELIFETASRVGVHACNGPGRATECPGLSRN